jgi:LuxR family glucitol operon transcriptional activator
MLQTLGKARTMRVKNATMEHFGRLLTQGLKSIAALEKTELTDLQHELGREIGVSVWTIYKWRKGTSIPNDDRTIGLLAKACIQRGRMDRQWLADFLLHTIYSNKQALIEQLFPISVGAAITQNLPRRHHTKLIGRDRELAAIKSFLSPRHRVGVVCISGGGGVGKTALALEVAHICSEDNINLPPEERFDAIIWVTAKNVELLPAGQAQRHPTFTDLDGIYRAIADLLDIPVIFRTATQAEQNIIITRLLAEKRVLLMLDNLEDVDDNELMIFLRDLPAPSKAVITTRHRIDVAVPVYLHTLDEDTAHELVHMECERHNLIMNDAHVKMLLHRTGGLPLAIIRTIGRMAWRGSNVETEIQHLDDPKNEIYDFCFAKTVALIQRGDAYALFMTLALFAADTNRESLGFVAGFGDDRLRRDEGLSDLEVLSLCHKNGDVFGLEPLTRTQALTELRSNPDFDAAARERWLEWYLNLTAHYGGRDGLEMHLRYDRLEEDWDNVLAVVRWCMDQGRYGDVLDLWEHVRDFTHIYGFWTDRLSLLNWLIVEADNRRDYPTTVEVMYYRAFTLTLTGPSTRLEEAESLLQRCWSLKDYSSPAMQARVAALLASLYIKHGRYTDAHHWLDTGEDLLRSSQLEPIELARERTSLLFDRGENWIMMSDYGKAQEVFEEMLEQAEISGWQRSVGYAQNWLAYTALLCKNPDLGERYLRQGFPIASRIKERRLSAYFKRTFAYYYREIGDHAEAMKWAEDALDSFERLGMPPDIREMQELIEQIRMNTEAV